MKKNKPTNLKDALELEAKQIAYMEEQISKLETRNTYYRLKAEIQESILREKVAKIRIVSLDIPPTEPTKTES